MDGSSRKTFPVSEHAVVKRINRKLRSLGYDEMLRKVRGERAILDLGEYFLHDFSRNLALDTHVDPEQYARDLGVLRDWEAVARD